MATRKTPAAGKGATRQLKQAQRVLDELRAERGALSRLAQALGLTPQAVHQWSIVPLERVIDVERATGIARHKLRPDHHNDPSATR